MSLQPQQQLPQQQQQPVLVYPANTVASQPPSHHSNGSFGTVFIVLAVVIAISAIACCLSRLCNRRYKNQRPKQNLGQSRPRENGDIEFGSDMRTPTSKMAANGGGSRGQRQLENGHDHARGEMNPGDHGGGSREPA
ncbi:hypothetical protein F2P56_030287 [Juglans regia]|uniref:Uncharacterized protein LOC109013723 n=2 Tax=Juglans regia TaxID=51240 RepID=A0A2I4H5P6_JUGRE|nr:uncharacterized protein LOC109013723 [Juglans regia]KAF5449886.1 hypothetical protein F2P56_030287 [Juglans regia]